MTFLTICFFSFLGTVNTSKFTVAVVPISQAFNIDATTSGYVVSFNVLALGVGNLFWVVMLRKVGRRPVYLVAIPIVFATNIWSYFATSYSSLLAASIIGGLGAAAAEAPTSAVVADLFFVHQRGTMLMIFHLALSCGFFLGPLLNAYVVEDAGWRYICLWIGIAAGCVWVVAFFTVHETAYRHRDCEASADRYEQLRPFRWWLNVHSGYDSSASFMSTIRNIFGVALYPAVPWVGLVVGCFIGWYARNLHQNIYIRTKD